MAGEAEVALGAVYSGVGFVAHVLGDLADVGVENRVSVQLDGDGGGDDGDSLEVPLAGGPEKSAMGGDDPVDGTVILARVEFRVSGVFGVEDLQFAHGAVGGPPGAGVSNGETVVSSGRQFELEADDKVGVFVLGINRASFAGPAHDGAVLDDVILDGAIPTGEIPAIENGLEAFGVAFVEQGIGLFGGDFTDEDVSPADFAAVGLQLNGTLGR